jgi:hypothetical protein
LAGHADQTGAAATQALVDKLRTLVLFLFGSLTEVQTYTAKEAPEEKQLLMPLFSLLVH